MNTRNWINNLEMKNNLIEIDDKILLKREILFHMFLSNKENLFLNLRICYF